MNHPYTFNSFVNDPGGFDSLTSTEGDPLYGDETYYGYGEEEYDYGEEGYEYEDQDYEFGDLDGKNNFEFFLVKLTSCDF